MESDTSDVDLDDVTPVMIVGGGIAGLIAAIEVAERGGKVVLHERSRHLGGRGRTSGREYRVNFGPHAIYSDGALWRWLKDRDLLPPTRPSNPLTVRFLYEGKARRGPPLPVLRSMLLSLRRAPADRTFRDWAREQLPNVSAEQLDAICRVSCFYSFAHDPGRLSARFINERNARLVRPPSPARFVSRGGWQAIIDQLEGRARDAGVDIHVKAAVSALPTGSVIVATELAAAEELLDEPLSAPQVDAVLLDVALDRRRGEPSAVLDLDGGTFIERYTYFDPTLAPEGQELLQCHAGRDDSEPAEAALGRIEAALDVTFKGWRARERWRAVRRSEGRSGAVELPGLSWQERPAIQRSPNHFLIGDAVRAPGLLSEVAVESAVQAATAVTSPAGDPIATGSIQGRAGDRL